MPLVKLKDGNGDLLTCATVPGFEGYFPFFPKIEETVPRIRNEFEVRPDDLWLITYPKCGTQWTSLVLQMLIAGKTTFELKNIEKGFLDMAGPDALAKVPSPRSLVSHFPTDAIPKQLFTVKPPVVVITRNPKDCLVSMYYFISGMKIPTPAGVISYDGKLDGFFELFATGELLGGSYFHFHRNYWKALADFDNVLWLSFEDAKNDLAGHVRKMAAFLRRLGYGEHLEDEAFLDKVVEVSSFDKMKESRQEQEKQAKPIGPQHQLKDDAKGYMRKGQSGDWKNHLNDEQSERIEKLFNEKFAGDEFEGLRELCGKKMK